MSQRLWNWLGWALVLTAIYAQCMIQRNYGSLRAGFFNCDKVCQVSAARGLLDGVGIAERWANPDDLSAPRVMPLYNWPVGYSLLVAGLLRAIDDPVRVVQAVDYAAIVVFFLAWLAIFELLGKSISPAVKLIFWSVWALVTSPLVPMTSAEMLAASLFSVALLAGMLAVKGRRPVAWGLASAVAAVAAASMRYSYWPLLAAVPLGLAAVALRPPRRRRLLAAAVACAVLAAVLLGALALYQRQSLGKTTYIVERYAGKQGLYWSRLAYVSPFPASMVGFLDVWTALRVIWPEWSDPAPFALRWQVSTGVLALLVVGGVYCGLTRRRRPDAPPGPAWHYFVASGLATTLLTLGMLGGLTLVTPGDRAEAYPGGYFTFLLEDRYFAVFAPFLIVALAGVLHGFCCAEHRGRSALKALAACVLIGWLALGLNARRDLIVERMPSHRPVRKAILRDVSTVWRAVRRHLDQGRNVAFLQRAQIDPSQGFADYFINVGAKMAGASLVPADVVRRPLAPRKNSMAIMTWAPNSESGLSTSLSDQVRRQGRFVEVARLWHGTLWEAVIAPSEPFAPLGSPP